MSRRVSRRTALKAMGAMATLLALPNARSVAFAGSNPFSTMAFNPNERRTVAIVGSGVAGLTAAYLAAKAGFRVVVFEGDDRYGGRSLTVRPSDAAYREWWFDKYNPHRLFPRMNVSSYQESDRSPDPAPQVANMAIKTWPGTDEPVELFLNAGPGRIPSNHSALLDLCQAVNVRLEPYIFLSGSNLLSSPTFKDGKPVPWRQINFSLMGELAEVMTAAVQDGYILQGYEEASVYNMLKQFGDLQANGTVDGSTTLGYLRQPGGWQSDIEVTRPVSLQDILGSGFVGSGDAEQSTGSFLFNPNHITWQPSLMQPVGGMDRIWQQLLLQPVPAQSCDYDQDVLGRIDFAGRDSGDLAGQRFVGDLVRLEHTVKYVDNVPDGVMIGVDGLSGPVAADFCIITAAPALVGGDRTAPASGDSGYSIPIPRDMAITTNLAPRLKRALADVRMTPAIKVGLQGRTRFWEEEDEIYGGISWTTTPSSQIWYPSEDFNAPTGVLTAAYNRGDAGYRYGTWSQARRIRQALRGGETLHNDYASKVYADDAMTIAWQYMPGQVGGWGDETYVNQADVYRRITNLPRGRVYFAGDTYSQVPGWQEGSVDSARLAIASILSGRPSTHPDLYRSRS